jgi:hypothetical protein
MVHSGMRTSKGNENTPTINATVLQIEKTVRERAERFLAVLHASISIKKLYAEGQTHEIVKARGLSLGAFYKQLERMLEGGGLYRDPVLLSAVLSDTGISVESLFHRSRNTTEQTTSSDLPEQDMSVQNVADQAKGGLQKPLRRTSLKVRLRSALNIVYLIQALRSNDSYEHAYLSLYLNYSRLKPGAYPHFRARSFLQPLDSLLSMYINNPSSTSMQQERIGRLITLAYILREIEALSRAYYRNTLIYKHNIGSTSLMLLRFEFENTSETSFFNALNNVPTRFKNNIGEMRSQSPNDPIWYVSDDLINSAICILVYLVLGGYWHESSNDNLSSIISTYLQIQNYFISNRRTIKIDKLFLDKLDELYHLLAFTKSGCDAFITVPITDVFVVPYSYKGEIRDEKDGSSWNKAFSTLSEAIIYLQDRATLEMPFRIKLARGMYRSTTDDFMLPQHVSLSGGWALKNNTIIQEEEPLNTIIFGRHGRAVLRGYLDHCIIENITFILDGEMPSYSYEKYFSRNGALADHDNAREILSPILAFPGSNTIVFKNCIFISQRVPNNPWFDNLELNTIAYYKCKAIEIS